MEMTNKKIFLSIRSTLPRFALLLYAVIPLIESNDWAFYICMFFIFAIFALSIIYSMGMYLKNSKEFISYIVGSKRDHLYDLTIAVLGIIISCSMNVVNRSYFWIFVLVFSIIALACPLNKKSKADAKHLY